MSGHDSNSAKSSRDSQHGDDSDPSYFVDSKVTRRPIRDNHSILSDSTTPGSEPSAYTTASEEFDDEKDFDKLNSAVRHFRETDIQRHQKLMHEIEKREEIIHEQHSEIHALTQELDRMKTDHASELNRLETLAKENHKFALRVGHAHEAYTEQNNELKQEIEEYHQELLAYDSTIGSSIDEMIAAREHMHTKLKALVDSSSAHRNAGEHASHYEVA